MKKIAIILFVCVIPLFVACGNGNSNRNNGKEIIGTWVSSDSGTIELKKDGTGSQKNNIGIKDFQWKTEDNILKLLLDDGTTAKLNYNLDNDKLELIPIEEKTLEESQIAKRQSELDNDLDIVGIWDSDGNFYDFELHKDGTGLLGKSNIEHWSAEDGILEIEAVNNFEYNEKEYISHIKISCNYEINNDTLIMNDVILEGYSSSDKETFERF